MNFNLFKPYSLLFYSTLIMGIFISLSANNWPSIWMGLELNLYSLIPLLLQSMKNQEKEAAVKYFLVQALASGMLLIGALNLNYSPIMPMFITLSLIMKLGMAPCHFWLPTVMNSLSWKMCWLISTVQKVAPLFILTQLLNSYSSSLISLLAAASAMVGGIGGLNQTQLRPILAYSSIGHLGWMTASVMTGPTFTTIYFLTYVLIISSIIPTLASTQNISSNFTAPLSFASTPYKMVLMLALFSLSGLPPFLGFYPKFLVLLSLTHNHLFFMAFILILSATINLFYYMKIISSFFFSSPLLKTFSPSSHYSSYLTTTLSTLSILPAIILLPMIIMN